MERLQIAIEKARQSRGQSGQRTQRAPANASRRSVSTDAWSSLPTFDPKPAHLLKHHIAVAPSDPGGNAVDMLRTRLLRLMRDNGWKRVMITSPTANCGKSTTAMNLAFAIRRQADLKTLLLDFDLRRPKLDRLLGINPESDVIDFLSGKITPQEHLFRVGDNLAISVGCNTHAEKSTEVLKSEGLVEKLDALDKLLVPAVMLFDLPPLFANDDAIAVASIVDCAVIVAAAGTTSVAQIDKTERELSQYTNIAGVVLNKCKFSSWSAGSYDDPYY